MLKSHSHYFSVLVLLVVPAGSRETSPNHTSTQNEESIQIVPEPAASGQQIQRCSLRGGGSGSGSKWESTAGSNVQNGLVEVPVMIERTSHCVCPYSARPEKLSHIEIRSLDSSPPQRRSPSFKTRSLSPAEQVMYSSNTLVDGHLDGDGFTREIFVDDFNKVKKNKAGSFTHARPIEVCDSRSTDSDSLQHTLNVMQLAAKKLENAIQLQSPRETSSVISIGSPSSDKTKGRVPRWAGKAYQDLKYIDEDADENGCMEVYRQDQRDAVFCSFGKLSAKEIMTSVQTLTDPCSPRTNDRDDEENNSAKNVTYMTRTSPIDLPEKRVVLAKPLGSSKPNTRGERLGQQASKDGISNSMCSIEETESQSDCSPQNSSPSSPLHQPCPVAVRRGSLELRHTFNNGDRTQVNLEVTQSASVPTSPVHKLVSKPRQKKAKSKQDLSTCKQPVIKSPLGRRRAKTKNFNKAVDSSDDEIAVSTAVDITTCANYKNLETFQKAQLTRKVTYQEFQNVLFN